MQADQYSAYPEKECAGRNEIATIVKVEMNECKRRCSQDTACVSFEFYSYSSDYTECHLSSSCTASLMHSQVYSVESGRLVTLYIKNLDNGAALLPKNEAVYDRYERACVPGHNLLAAGDTNHMEGKTVSECAAICTTMPTCRGFEYGVDYGGITKHGAGFIGAVKPGHCMPSDSTDTTLSPFCDGVARNLDFYAAAPPPPPPAADPCQHGGSLAADDATCACGFGWLGEFCGVPEAHPAAVCAEAATMFPEFHGAH
jgi:hypothetical protein